MTRWKTCKKALVPVATALASLAVALGDGHLSAAELCVVGVQLLAGAGVYAIPNQPRGQ